MKTANIIPWLLKSSGSRWLLFITIILTIISAVGLKNMGVSSDYKIFLIKMTMIL